MYSRHKLKYRLVQGLFLGKILNDYNGVLNFLVSEVKFNILQHSNKPHGYAYFSKQRMSPLSST